jgi:DNA-binding NarL/FixJ family response regulator
MPSGREARRPPGHGLAAGALPAIAPPAPRRLTRGVPVGLAARVSADDRPDTSSAIVALLAPMLRIAVSGVLEESGIAVLDEPRDGVELWRALRRLHPDLLVVGDQIGHEALRRLRDASAATRIMLLARCPGDLYGRLVVGAGASCVDEGASRHELVAALDATLRGEHVFVSAEGSARRLAAAMSRLTRREREVVGLLGEEHSYDEIALALTIEPETAKTHVKRIYRKLGVHSRAQLRELVFEDGRETRTG